MKITVDRYRSNANATLSKVYVNGQFICYGLEDKYRPDGQKVDGETRIPAGKYRVTARTEGGFHSRYKKKFGDWHRGMLWVRDVPGFEWILIHIGNTDADTAGCLLVGLSATESTMFVGNSTGAYKKLYPMVIDAALAGDLEIEYLDNDRE